MKFAIRPKKSPIGIAASVVIRPRRDRLPTQITLQIAGERRRAGISIGRCLRRRLQHDRIEVTAQLPHQFALRNSPCDTRLGRKVRAGPGHLGGNDRLLQQRH